MHILQIDNSKPCYSNTMRSQAGQASSDVCEVPGIRVSAWTITSGEDLSYK